MVAIIEVVSNKITEYTSNIKDLDLQISILDEFCKIGTTNGADVQREKELLNISKSRKLLLNGWGSRFSNYTFNTLDSKKDLVITLLKESNSLTQLEQIAQLLTLYSSTLQGENLLSFSDNWCVLLILLSELAQETSLLVWKSRASKFIDATMEENFLNKIGERISPVIKIKLSLMSYNSKIKQKTVDFLLVLFKDTTEKKILI